MEYKIKIEYTTGDSFKTENASDYVELTWNDIEVAKANLKRIEEHYRVYRAYKYQNSSNWKLIVDSKDRELFDTRKTKDWYVDDKDHFEEKLSIILKTDEGKDWRFRPFWCGYFEHLETATIEIDDSDLKITF